MAVQILNDMPDAAVHRGEPPSLSAANQSPRQSSIDQPSLAEWTPRAAASSRAPGRAVFAAITIGLHVLAAIAFLSVQYASRSEAPPAPMVVSLMEAPENTEEAPPMAPPPMQEVVYTLPAPDQIAIEVESITPPPVTTAAISPPSTQQSVAPPMVESVEYRNMPTLVYPSESKRRREEGTVILRVLVDASGRPAEIRIERSSGFDRLDRAAREMILKALFRPYESNGIAQAAQVLIPVEFGIKKRSS